LLDAASKRICIWLGVTSQNFAFQFSQKDITSWTNRCPWS